MYTNKQLALILEHRSEQDAAFPDPRSGIGTLAQAEVVAELLPFPAQGLLGRELALAHRSDRRAPRIAPDRYHPSYPKEGRQSTPKSS